MKPLHEHMGMYSAYHRHPMNRVIHFIMVPAIVWSLMIWLDMLGLVTVSGITISAAMVVTAALLIWYLMLDFAIGFAAVLVFTVLLVTAMEVREAMGNNAAALLAAGIFVGSWVFQFLGHGVWEKRRPALMDNLFQVFVAPAFLIAETAFAWGMKKELHDKVEAEMQQYLPDSPAAHGAEAA